MASRTIRLLRRFAVRGGPLYLPGERVAFEAGLAERLVVDGVAAWADNAPPAPPEPPSVAAATPVAPEAHTMVVGAVPKNRGSRHRRG